MNATPDPSAQGQPEASAPLGTQPLVMVSWDGRGAALACLLCDVAPQFELVIFDYSGGQQTPVLPPGVHATMLRQATECKGELYRALAAWLATRGAPPSFVSLIDDDVILSVSDIHRVLHAGRTLDLHAFSPALTHDSHFTHRFTLQGTRQLARQVDWVEVMMPFYRGELFMQLAPHLGDNVSSWGIDRYLVPTVQQVMGLTRTAVVDAVAASHMRPVTSGQKTYRNGLTAAQESAKLKQASLALLQAHRPDLLGTAWHHRLFEQRHALSRWGMLKQGLGRPLRRWLESST